MKYLVLFLLVMFSCNVNASEPKATIDINSYIPICRHELFSEDDTVKEKARVCYIAHLLRNDEFEEFKLRGEDMPMALLDESLEFLVKSCNFYWFYNRTQTNRCYYFKNLYNESCKESCDKGVLCLKPNDHMCKTLEKLK